MFNGTGLEGGVFQDFSLRSTTATFVYLPHFAVVSHFASALLRPRAACRARTRATPPQKQGGHVTLIAVLSSIPLSRPHGVALVLIYPCGKAQKQPPRSGAGLLVGRVNFSVA